MELMLLRDVAMSDWIRVEISVVAMFTGWCFSLDFWCSCLLCLLCVFVASCESKECGVFLWDK